MVSAALCSLLEDWALVATEVHSVQNRNRHAMLRSQTTSFLMAMPSRPSPWVGPGCNRAVLVIGDTRIET